MRAVVQRVKRARVVVDQSTSGEIEAGLLVFVGVGAEDTDADANYLGDKVAGLRIFEDESGKMSRSVSDVGGRVLVVSQFTLYGDVRRGRRPSFDAAAPPAEANRLYELFCERLRQAGIQVNTGVFQAMMDVELVNHGPVTILIDSKKTF